MADFVAKLQELKEKIVYEFDGLRDFNNDDDDQIKQKSLYGLLFKIKYHIDQMKNDILSGRVEDSSIRIKDQKAAALIKLQTLSSLITSNAINLVDK